MDGVLLDLISELPGEILGIFDHDQKITGFDKNTILIQSLFFHYPEIFKQLNLSVRYFVILNPVSRSLIQSISHSTGLSPQSLIFDLLRLDPHLPYTTSQFPSADDLEDALVSSAHFREFHPDERYSTLVEKLILQYHLMIQPEHLISALLHDGPSGGFEAICVDMTAENAKDMLDLASFTSFHVRRPDYELINRLHLYANRIKELDPLL